MTLQMLQTADKLLFVKMLYDYASRPTNTKIKSQYAETLGVSERSFQDKMLTHRNFKGQELDLVESLYLAELGQAVVDNQLSIFLQKMSDGDARTNAGDAAFQNIDSGVHSAIEELNNEMENGGVLISKSIS